MMLRIVKFSIYKTDMASALIANCIQAYVPQIFIRSAQAMTLYILASELGVSWLPGNNKRRKMVFGASLRRQCFLVFHQPLSLIFLYTE